MSQPNPTPPPNLRDRAASYALAFAELNAASRAGKTPRSQRALLAHLRTEEAAGRVPVGFAKFYRAYYGASAVLALAVGVGVGYAGYRPSLASEVLSSRLLSVRGYGTYRCTMTPSIVLVLADTRSRPLYAYTFHVEPVSIRMYGDSTWSCRDAVVQFISWL
ncbi:hypothetical protein CcaverHIS002_0207470 [Cutaneotrichosporon cavernicola]|uniref:Uncharacterized protein n=1 Tax=Cutaneotrichosporon cavernicola TaxID=279322 RepID=A0AA48IFQ5_9TREE|nr:uncharacterized protein CcaverHIS019_0207450 [Cutaneotrichosporon cavernicola]BEI81587.1 hypothetical protein CcaverHIS002_0207470 [Cutaneotrichosporon cavernicola]BEI89383.1 hypothetical protein CcaverHIS019_0207450 [Cutaneotrichosporon cavernicola]